MTEPRIIEREDGWVTITTAPIEVRHRTRRLGFFWLIAG
jgi:hypothetical protein